MAVDAKKVNSRLAKHPLVFNGRLANRGLTSLEKIGHSGCLWHQAKSSHVIMFSKGKDFD